jgi:hypothetical protein
MFPVYSFTRIYIFWPPLSSLEIKKQTQRIYKTLHQQARKSGIVLQSGAIT